MLHVFKRRIKHIPFDRVEVLILIIGTTHIGSEKRKANQDRHT